MGARVSFDPDKQTKAGGIPDDIDATIVGARAGYFDYPGTVITAVCLLLDIEDDNGQRYEGVPYTVGGKITPTEDGTGFEFDTDRDDGASFNDKTGAGKFFRELGNAGAKRLVVEASGDCTRLVGLYGHWKNIEKTVVDPSKKKDDFGIAVITKVHKLPGEQGKGKPSGAGAGAAGAKPKTGTAAKVASPAAAQAAENNGALGDLADALRPVIMELVAEAGGAITKGKLSQALLAKIKDDPDWSPSRNDAIKLALNNDFLKSEESAPFWAYDGKELKAVE